MRAVFMPFHRSLNSNIKSFALKVYFDFSCCMFEVQSILYYISELVKEL